VARPASADEVRALLRLARSLGACIIPYGGGTSVVGHINPPAGDAPVLTLSLERLNHLLDLDEASRLATFEAGVAGPHLEQQLQARGYTLGHFPQSFEYSTLGGWIATRSSGQQSYYYGRIEALFAGGRLETPRGPLDLPAFPASAAGPDLRELVLGSEGRLGVIVQARVRVRPKPEAEAFYGIFFPTWEQGVAAVRAVVQSDVPVSMLRLSNPLETEVTLTLAGKRWIDWADRGLRLIGYGAARCLLVFGATGTPAHVRRARGTVEAFGRRFGGLPVGTTVGHTWQKSRFLSPYLRNTLWEQGVAVDTLETALPWSQVPAAAEAVPQAIRAAAEAQGERVLAFAHLSHLYRDGASLYTTYLFRRAADPDELVARWQAMKHAASLVLQRHGGTITHQHGVGVDHAPYLEVEKGALGLEALRAAVRVFDPDGLMNPGKLL
jgi:alkyldihydroxyacetonephosphate synthase